MKCTRQHDEACSGQEATQKITWLPTGQVLKVCENCAEAITKRSKRSGQNWTKGG